MIINLSQIYLAIYYKNTPLNTSLKGLSDVSYLFTTLYKITVYLHPMKSAMAKNM